MDWQVALSSFIGSTLLMGMLAYFIKKYFDSIDKKLDNLINKVNVQNGRVTKLETQAEENKHTREFIAKESDRRISTIEGEVKSIWNTLRITADVVTLKNRP